VNAVTTACSKLESVMFDGPQWHSSWKMLWNPFSSNLKGQEHRTMHMHTKHHDFISVLPTHDKICSAHTSHGSPQQLVPCIL
jgi:hypothetical protein